MSKSRRARLSASLSPVHSIIHISGALLPMKLSCDGGSKIFARRATHEARRRARCCRAGAAGGRRGVADVSRGAPPSWRPSFKPVAVLASAHRSPTRARIGGENVQRANACHRHRLSSRDVLRARGASLARIGAQCFADQRCAAMALVVAPACTALEMMQRAIGHRASRKKFRPKETATSFASRGKHRFHRMRQYAGNQ